MIRRAGESLLAFENIESCQSDLALSDLALFGRADGSCTIGAYTTK